MERVFSVDEIDEVAAWFIEHTGKSGIIAVHGEMGAGKTTFISAICRYLGVAEAVSSPTFSIINEYRGKTGKIYHLDLYRLKSETEAIEAGIEECLFPDSLCFVEWPERLPGFFNEALHCCLEVVSADRRKIRINA